MFAQLILSEFTLAHSAIFAFIWYDPGAICGLLNSSFPLLNVFNVWIVLLSSQTNIPV